MPLVALVALCLPTPKTASAPAGLESGCSLCSSRTLPQVQVLRHLPQACLERLPPIALVSAVDSKYMLKLVSACLGCRSCVQGVCKSVLMGARL